MGWFFWAKKDATVSFKADIVAPDPKSDSFSIRVDGDDEDTKVLWECGKKSSFGWSKTSPEFDVKKGQHTLIIHGREDGIKLRKVKFEKGGEDVSFARFKEDGGGGSSEEEEEEKEEEE